MEVDGGLYVCWTDGLTAHDSVRQGEKGVGESGMTDPPHVLDEIGTDVVAGVLAV